MTTRRLFLQGLAAAASGARGSLLSDTGMLGAAYIARRGEHVRRHAEGMALLPGGHWRAFNERQPFRVASVSKMIAAFGVMHLATSGALDLDADISGYLGAPVRHPAFPDTPITTRMLMSHTSGLRNGLDFPVPFMHPLLDRLQRAAREPEFGGWFAPATEPPARWFAYSDTNIALVAQIVERLTNRRFDRFMHDTVFAPARLDIGYNWSGVSQAKRARAAAGCRWIDGAWAAQVDGAPPASPEIALYRGDGDAHSTEADYRLGQNGFAFAPQGGLRLSLSDMEVLAGALLRRAPALMQNPVWTYDTITPNGETNSGFYQAYGLGVQIPLGRPSDNYFGAESSDWRGHAGDAYGWMTGIWWNARTQTTLVYAINGMPEENRRRSTRTAMTEAEQAVIDAALAALD